jgi:uncharacterized repeat protein (TIGR01451 family)
MSNSKQRKRAQRARTARQVMASSQQAAVPDDPTPAAKTLRLTRHGMIFAALCAVCLMVAGGYVAWAVVRGDAGSGGGIGGPINDGGAPGSIARVRGSTGAVMFQNVVTGDHWNQIGIVPLGQPEGERSMMPLRCLRVHFAAGRGLCLAEGNGPPGTYAAYIFDADLKVTDDVDLGGLPSRTRISPDARYGATTAFVTGHSYAEDGYSTETLLIDLDSGEKVANLEEFAAYKDGQQFEHETFNYWGVTFKQDSNRFYATLGSEEQTYLVEGDIAAREVHVLRENVECPSLSPDNTKLAFKKKVGGGLSGAVWRFHVLDLATMTETPLAEARSIDDQIEWLDNEHVLYGDNADTWVMAADGSGQPRRFMSKAVSPTVLQGVENAGSGSPVAAESGDQAASGDTLTLPETDLGVTVDVPESAPAGVALTYTVTVTNHGPNEATWLVVDHFLPERATYVEGVSVDPPGMTYGCAAYAEENRVRCDTSSLAPGASWTIAFTVTPEAAGTPSIWVNVGATENDPNPANDRVETKVTVGP